MVSPKARKLPSGAWCARVMIDGKSHTITRNTKREAEKEAMALKCGAKQAAVDQPVTLDQACRQYIEARRNTCSPSTIRGYECIRKTRFKDLMDRDIRTITDQQWQQAISQERRLVSAKTIKGAWGLIASVVDHVTGHRPRVTVPQVIPNERPFLSAEQIPVFVEAIKGTHIEIPALLALSSLRLSEILALRWKDVDIENGLLRIDGAAVLDDNDNLIRKRETKNQSSRRTVPIIPPLLAALQQVEPAGEYVTTIPRNTLRNGINRICSRNDLPQVGIHGLRHSFASLCEHLNVPLKVAMEIGGWSDYTTMKKIYTHVSENDIKEKSSQITSFFDL